MRTPHNKQNSTVIVVPVYREELTDFERISLEQCFTILSATYPICCVKPRKLRMNRLAETYPFSEVISFEDDYFADVQGYNRLMLSCGFYKTFLQFEFMLIYQLDAFIFKNNLHYWTSLKFDYIGAPWLRGQEYPDIIKKIKCKLLAYYHVKTNKQVKGIPTEEQFENKVGNGGFSLRRVNKFYELATKHKNLIDFYNSRLHHHFHEDAFWSVEINRNVRKLKIPSYKKAVQFSFENMPDRCYTINNRRLPTGCHAWDKNLDFWRPVLRKWNYFV